MKVTVGTFVDLKTFFDNYGKEIPECLVLEVHEKDTHSMFYKDYLGDLKAPKVGEYGRFLGIRFRIVE